MASLMILTGLPKRDLRELTLVEISEYVKLRRRQQRRRPSRR